MSTATITTKNKTIRQTPDSSVAEIQESVCISLVSPGIVSEGKVLSVEKNSELGEGYVRIDSSLVYFCLPIEALPEWLKVGQRVIVDLREMKVYKG